MAPPEVAGRGGTTAQTYQLSPTKEKSLGVSYMDSTIRTRVAEYPGPQDDMTSEGTEALAERISHITSGLDAGGVPEEVGDFAGLVEDHVRRVK